MADIFDAAKRSEIMSRIRGKNTKPELLVFRYLRREGIYFQKHYRTKEGIVLDVALPRKKKAVFIDGDFWHGRTIGRVMKRGRNDYWAKKILRNMERDEKQVIKLSEARWQILRVWESDLVRKRTQHKTLEMLQRFLLS